MQRTPLTAVTAILSFTFLGATAAEKKDPPVSVQRGSNGKLIYTPDAQGNIVPDFSLCG